MYVYHLCHINLNYGANIPNNYYMEEFCKYYFQKQHKKSDQRRSVTITLSIIPFQTIRKA